MISVMRSTGVNKDDAHVEPYGYDVIVLGMRFSFEELWLSRALLSDRTGKHGD